MEQQTATAEVLQVINSSPGELAPVFDAMLEKAARLCEAHTGHLGRWENGALTRVASFRVPEEFDQVLPRNAPMTDALVRKSVPARMIATRSIVHVPDLRDDESFHGEAPVEIAAVRAGIRTASLSRPMSSLAPSTHIARRLALRRTCHTGLSLLFEVGVRPPHDGMRRMGRPNLSGAVATD